MASADEPTFRPYREYRAEAIGKRMGLDRAATEEEQARWRAEREERNNEALRALAAAGDPVAIDALDAPIVESPHSPAAEARSRESVAKSLEQIERGDKLYTQEEVDAYSRPTLTECLVHLTAATNRAAMLRWEAAYIEAPVARALVRWLRAEVEEDVET